MRLCQPYRAEYTLLPSQVFDFLAERDDHHEEGQREDHERDHHCEQIRRCANCLKLVCEADPVFNVHSLIANELKYTVTKELHLFLGAVWSYRDEQLVFGDVVQEIVLGVEKLQTLVHFRVCLLQLLGQNLVVMLGCLDCVAPVLETFHDFSGCEAARSGFAHEPNDLHGKVHMFLTISKAHQ